MEVKNKKKQSQFDVNVVLLTLEGDTILNQLFREYVSIDYTKLLSMHKSDILNGETLSVIQKMFDEVISENETFIELYQFTFEKFNGTLDTEEKSKRVRIRINKQNVLKAKETDKRLAHTAALLILRLKNLHPRLERAYANEMVHGEPLGDDKWKQLMGVIETTEKKINQILKVK